MEKLNLLFQIIGLNIVLFLFVYYLGFGITYLLLPKDSHKYALLIMPLLGISLIFPVSEIIAYLQLSIIYAVITIILISTVLNIFVFRKKLYSNLSSNCRYCLISFLFSILSAVPIIIKGSLVTIGENGDIISYSSVSDYIMLFGRTLPAATDHRPTMALINLWINNGARMGQIYFLSILNSILNMFSDQTFTIASNLCFALTICSMVFLAKLIFNLSNKYCYLLSAFVGLNSIILWSSYGGFLSQNMAVLFYPAAIGAAIYTLKNNSTRYTIITAIFLCSIFITYNESLIYFISILSIYVLVQLVTKKFRISVVLQKLGILVLSVAILIPFALQRAYQSFLQYFNSTEFQSSGNRMLSGNIRYFVSLAEAFGFVPHRQDINVTVQLPAKISICIYMAVILTLIGIMIGYILKYMQKEYDQFLIIASMAFTLFSGAIVNYFLRFPYGYYKNVTFVGLFFPLLLIIATEAGHRVNKILKPMNLFICLLLALNINSFIVSIIKAGTTNDGLNANIKGVHALNDIFEEDDLVYVKGYQPGVRQMWINYYLTKPMLAWDSIIGYYGSSEDYRPTRLPNYIIYPDTMLNNVETGYYLYSKNNEYSVYKVMENLESVHRLTENNKLLKLNTGDQICAQMESDSLKLIINQQQEFVLPFNKEGRIVIPVLGAGMENITIDFKKLQINGENLIVNTLDSKSFLIQNLCDGTIYFDKVLVFRK